MTITLDAPAVAADVTDASPDAETRAFAIPALTSIAAGLIHASAMGAHGDMREAVLAFGLTAAIQVGLGVIVLVLALTSRPRFAAIALAAANLAVLAGWIVSRRTGLDFIEGLEEAQPIARADGLAAGFAAASVLGVVMAFRGVRLARGGVVARALAVPVAAVMVVGMVAASSPDHHGAGADGDQHAAETNVDASRAAVVPPTPFIPGQPIDLGGVPGVTPQQQAAAENLLSATLYVLPKWSDYQVAEAAGWRSIGDGATGEEHFVNPATLNDGRILDPNAPESLVYDNTNGVRTLAAAMYMLDPGTTLADVPEVGGKLMQWHIHDNLCFSPTGRVAGLREPGGECRPGLVKGGEQPMIHVWIRSHPCGPFAALTGIAGGSIAAGETRLCDTAHGH